VSEQVAQPEKASLCRGSGSVPALPDGCSRSSLIVGLSLFTAPPGSTSTTPLINAHPPVRPKLGYYAGAQCNAPCLSLKFAKNRKLSARQSARIMSVMFSGLGRLWGFAGGVSGGFSFCWAVQVGHQT